ncbi:MAG: hypothetical protein A3E87_00800 [Gammaproteobacteria bacterium RIFCSPHIGHO2_12_FULL_35_23]|nr:MAG: hypothetical protein A3E87_00800 [Gammaproteobacteria bacterium RIFCSPHIGHO2_12_FULL_35_23]
MKIKPLAFAILAASTMSAGSIYATTASTQTPANTTSALTETSKAVGNSSTVSTGKTETSTAAGQQANTTAPAKLPLNPEGTNSVTEIKSDQAYLQEELAEIDENNGIPFGQWDWYKHIHLSGLVNVDASYWSKPYFGQGTQETTASSYLSLATANLNVDADFGDWVTAHMGFLYTNGSSPSVVNYSPSLRVNRRANMQEAYGTIANFNIAPFYVRAGQQFLPFSRYYLYPITQSFTQILSQTDLPAVTAGFISQSGVYATAYAANGIKEANHSSSTINVYGAEMGYQNFNHSIGYDLGLGYLNNLADVDSIRDIANDNNGYTRSAGGLSAYGDLYAGPFGFGVRYVGALRRFSPVDYQFTNGTVNKGAKPTAVGVNTDYNFKTWGHNSRIELGFQWTTQAHNTASGVSLNNVTRLPKTRWLVEYGFNLIRHVALGLQFYQDHDYSAKYGGTNKKDNVVTARISFLF